LLEELEMCNSIFRYGNNNEYKVLCNLGYCPNFFNPYIDRFYQRTITDCRGVETEFFFCSQECLKRHKHLYPESKFGIMSIPDEEGYF